MSRRTVFCLICAVVLIAGVGRLPELALGAAVADKSPTNTASVKVIYEGYYAHYVLVELYHDGRLLSTRELTRNFAALGSDSVTFSKLVPGRYELHFEGAGYKKYIKRIAIGQDDREVTAHVELDQKEEKVNVGPSLQELKKRIAELERANAELRAEINNLKKK